jgi:ABC-type glycerol-3-phosphate transport system substrate-binding protein
MPSAPIADRPVDGADPGSRRLPTPSMIAPPVMESQRRRTQIIVGIRADVLTIVPSDRDNPPCGLPARGSRAGVSEEEHMADHGQRPVSRRTLLRGSAAVAALGGISAFIAACTSSNSTPSPTAAATAASVAPTAAATAAGSPSAAASGSPSAAASGASGNVTLGSNYSDPVPKGVLANIVNTFQTQTGSTVKVNTVDHNTFQDQISAYLQGTPDDVFTWFSGFRMRFFAAQGLATDISDVWAQVGSNFSDAFKVGSTGDDGKQYFIPIYNYPWAVFYRKSVFQSKGYQIPATLDDFKTLCKKMQTDGLIPIAFGDSDGWPAMGTFDIINLRTNGYDFHVGLMAGKQKWTDPKVTTVFNTFKDLLPYHQDGAAGRKWQDAAQTLVQKKAGMYLLGMFVSQQFQTAGAADLADLDSSRTRASGRSTTPRRRSTPRSTASC